jgi:molybdopterin/thiamine biosynthesis adenylyltransferase
MHSSTRELEVYSRQQLVLGQHGLHSLFRSSLCICGVDGQGVEIAKNALLAGVHNITLCDSLPVSPLDISTNICLRSKPFESYKGTRAQECAQVLQTFNPSATIVVRDTLDLQEITPNLVVVCNQGWARSQEIARQCREKNVPVIISFTGGLYYLYASDLGTHHYLDVQDNKQDDVPLINVVEIPGTIDSIVANIVSQVQITEGAPNDEPEHTNPPEETPQVVVSENQLSISINQQPLGGPDIHAQEAPKNESPVPSGEIQTPITSEDINMHAAPTIAEDWEMVPESEQVSHSSTITSESNEPHSNSQSPVCILPFGNSTPEVHKTEIEENPPTRERQYRATMPSEGVFTLQPGDQVEVIASNGLKIGLANITTVSHEMAYFELSSVTKIESGHFIQFLPLEATISYAPLSELQDNSEGVSFPLIEGLKALDSFYATQHRLPTPRNTDDLNSFLSGVQGLRDDMKEFYTQFCFSSASPIVPINSIVGGLIAEEVVKVLSRCFPPALCLNSAIYFEYLYQEGLTPVDCAVDYNNEFDLLYSSQILNFGRSFQQKLAGKSIFVVGAGALGNEYAKGIAMLGACTHGESSLTVVDNDLVMTSNISRQLCFGESDTHKTKADTLCHKIKELFNPHTRTTPYLLKLDHTSEDKIGHTHLSKMDLYVTALDNIAARHTVERISHMYDKPLIDGGTEGFEGSQDNFIPNVTNEYYSPHWQPTRVVNCTPKPVVSTKLDVIHNAKLHFENLLDKAFSKKGDNPMQLLLDDIKSVWENAPAEAKNEDGSLKGGKIPLLASPTEKQLEEFSQVLTAITSHENNAEQKFFDKDEPLHVRLLDVICQLVATTHNIPHPDIMEIRKKAGNIIPNIISTTAIISGFMQLNTLQLANNSLKFVNVNYGQAFVQHFRAEDPTPDRKSIHYFREMHSFTQFKDLIAAVPTPYPDIEECTIYGSSKVVLTGKAITRIANARALRYLLSHASLGGRRHVVMELVFRKLERQEGQIRIFRRTKFLISSLPSEEVLAPLRDSVAKEYKLVSLLSLLEEAQKTDALSLLEEIQNESDADIYTLIALRNTEQAQWQQKCEQLESENRALVDSVTASTNNIELISKELASTKSREVEARNNFHRAQAEHSTAVIQLEIERQRTAKLEQELDELRSRISESVATFASISQLASKAFHSTSQLVVSPLQQTKPLSLHNLGNTCFLASCTQLLYTAHVHAGRSIFSANTSVGRSLTQLFTTRSDSDWSGFANLFYSENRAFIRGRQDDSAKAFEAIVGRDWILPDITDTIHMIIKAHSVVPDGNCHETGITSSIVDHYLVYSGYDEADANIGNELIMQESYERCCDSGCGKVQEKTEFVSLPKILFMVASVGRNFLHAAQTFQIPINNSQIPVRYNLIGASLHSGNNRGGHYTALVEHGGAWYSCSDSSWHQVNLLNFINSNYEDVQLLVFAKQ